MFTIAGAKKRLSRLKRGESAPENKNDGMLTDIKRELKEIKKIIS
jgi:hypothetical protein